LNLIDSDGNLLIYYESTRFCVPSKKKSVFPTCYRFLRRAGF